MPRLSRLAPFVLTLAAACHSGGAATPTPSRTAMPVSVTLASDVSSRWPQHSLDRPQPPVVDPGPYVGPARPPSDAIVLFDGRDLSQWRGGESGTELARWKVQDGYMEVVAGTGGIRTARDFGDVQLHIEWMAPTPPRGESQERGNSGVFFMGGRYEIQVLDSYQNTTYPDGQASAVYGQYPPRVNASRPPGEWQTYDIVFHRPRFDGERLTSPARVTVLHNGVLTQDDVVLIGPTANQARPPYEAHPDRLPISLQDHGNPVRFRNVWVREIE